MHVRQLVCRRDSAPLAAAVQVSAASISSNDFRSGVFIEVDGAPYRVLGTRASAATRAHARVQGFGAITNPFMQSTCTSSPARAPLLCARS